MLQHEAHFLDCLTKLQNQLSNINYDDILTAILFLNIELKIFCLTVNNGPRSYIVTVSVLMIMTVVVLVIIAICLYTKLKSKQLNPSIRLDEIG